MFWYPENKLWVSTSVYQRFLIEVEPSTSTAILVTFLATTAQCQNYVSPLPKQEYFENYDSL